jgi:hypothetical protein
MHSYAVITESDNFLGALGAVPGLYSISISKSLYPSRETKAADGNSYDITRKGVCNLNFVDNVHERTRVGDFIYVIRMSQGGVPLPDAIEKGLGKIVFQGIIVHNGWSQYVDSGQNFRSMFNVKAYDLTSLLMDANFFPYSFFTSPYTPKWQYHKALSKYYGIDLDKIYQRDEIVNKIVRGYVDNRLKNGWYNSALNNVLGANPGFRYEGSLGGYDYVSASDIFKTMSTYSTCWDYLSSLTSHPLFELFVREDSGEIVFRRSCWDKPGSYFGRLSRSLGALNSQFLANTGRGLRKSESFKHEIEKDDLVAVHVDHNWEGVSNAIQMASASGTLPMSTLPKGFHSKYGIKLSGTNDRPPKYNPALMEHSRMLGDAFKNVFKGDLVRAISGFTNQKSFSEIEVQDDLLRRNIADIFRGTVTLRKWMDISVGDHVKLGDVSAWESVIDVLRGLITNNPSLSVAWMGGWPGIAAGLLIDMALKRDQNRITKSEDMLFYVTGKQLDATVSENGQMVETFKLNLNFGGLEFVTGYDHVHIKHFPD